VSINTSKNFVSERVSVIYKNIWLYRFVVGLLYLGKYNTRFKNVTLFLDPVQDNSVTELCFGDIYVAKWCRKNDIKYLGMDINQYFVSMAQRKGYNAKVGDIRLYPELPNSDVVVMISALYHFYDIFPELLDYIMNSSKRFIISEPIHNLSSMNNLIGKISHKLTNAGSGNEIYRYNKQSLVNAVQTASNNRYLVRYHYDKKDMIVEISHKNL